MSWPKLNEIVKATDWSWWQNYGAGQDHRPADPAEFVEKNPEIDIYWIRGIWPSGKIDQHFQHYYDGFSNAGKKVAVYLWPNPTKSIQQTADNWLFALDGREPTVIGIDAELTWYKPPNILTTNIRKSLDKACELFPKAKVVPYTRASWWDRYILPGWESVWNFWLAHYPYMVYDLASGKWRMVYNFTEMDKCLPIDNSFTPFLGKTLQIEQVIGWQFSDKGKLAGCPTKSLDLNYFKLWWINKAWEESEPEPPPSTNKIIRVIIPSGVEVVVERV